MQALASTAGMERAAWLKLRRQGIGGSDAAAILGLNPYKSPLAVYADKRGLTDDAPDTETLRQGRDFEAYVADRFAEETGKRVRRCNQILQHPDRPWMLANVDRLVVGERAGLECKCVGIGNRVDFEGGAVPPTFYWQCMHYLAVTGLDRWYLAVLPLGRWVAPYIFEIARDETQIDELTAREEAFWTDHVLAGVPPLPIGSEADEAVLTRLSEQHGQDETVAIPEMDADLDLMAALQADRRALDAQIEAIEQRVKLRMGSAERASGNRWRVDWKTVETHRLDSKRLQAQLPDVYRQYTNIAKSRRFRVTSIREKE
ncbi:MAG TPA: YqaJ viral recombinase family protein [Candidatus Alectryocaccomicrobium excrementavium]|uniref:YqaJ viral recombinase family protein n=1 Tax=Candidatus Alectryocaccomicrobium excrementavium TaxID=2840668 RepID=A0A9D1K7M5_9FIRM|nr:YqaJ viral recombinase family protein [Candidatus Alectryocaccomicrobium excrementavium]